MQNQWTERISEYVDGELSASDRRDFEQRMDEDPELRRSVAEVRNIVQQAGQLGPVEPERDLWPRIASRLGNASSHRSRRRSAPAPRPELWRRLAVVAAGLVLMVVSGATGWWLHDRATPSLPDLASLERPALRPIDPDAASAGFAEQEERLAESIQELESLLLRFGDRLDPDTREAIASNLEVIDSAIEDAQRALLEDPNDDYLHSHITASLERKVRLLEDAAHLASREI
jgi:hypothetical protein